MKSLIRTLWDSLAIWKKQKKYKLGVDFEFYDFEESNLTGIKLISGKYSGFIYYYTYASFTEEMNLARLKFGYNVVNASKDERVSLENDSDFVIMLGDILTEIVITEKQIESTRTIYSEESTL